MLKPPQKPNEPSPAGRPTAWLRVAPTGTPDQVPRDYLISVELALPGLAGDPAGVAHALEIVSEALSGKSSGTTATDRPQAHEIRKTGKPNKEGVAITTVTGVEAAVVGAGWPNQAVMDGIRSDLAERGCRVVTEERRACAEPGCRADALVQSTRRDVPPHGWYSEQICGRHNYRACTSCQSVFRLMSSNSAGPGPSVVCAVCGALLVEWGGSKLWEAELMSRGPGAPPAASPEALPT